MCKSSFEAVEWGRQPVKVSGFGPGLSQPYINFKHGGFYSNTDAIRF